MNLLSFFNPDTHKTMTSIKHSPPSAAHTEAYLIQSVITKGLEYEVQTFPKKLHKLKKKKKIKPQKNHHLQ